MLASASPRTTAYGSPSHEKPIPAREPASPARRGARRAAQRARPPSPGATPRSSAPWISPPPTSTARPAASPGPAYWQQRADYRIRATLDPAGQRLSGSETIHYHNNSPDTLRFVWLQADQNLYRPGSLGSFMNPARSRWGARDFAGGLELEEVAGGGGQAVQPHVYDTMMRLDLPRPLAPGRSVDLAALAGRSTSPSTAPTAWAASGKLYEIAQWYPRMAVYDDVRGWNTDPYLGQGEFYREFGDYDVSITVPAGYVVAATGTLQNPQEVLTAAQRAAAGARRPRHGSRWPSSARRRRAPPPRGPAAPAPSPGASRAGNVHDFAWAASPKFAWDATSWNGVRCHALYQPDASPAWRKGAEMTCYAIRDFSRRWFPYP